MVNEADAVFFSGGKSGYIQECLFGGGMNGTETPILTAIKAKEIVAGTSAGAMIQPIKDIMITGITCESYTCIRNRDVYHRDRGFGLFTHVLVDVHFAERGRQGLHITHMLLITKIYRSLVRTCMANKIKILLWC